MPPLIRPFIAPVRASINSRGLDTTFASCGAATGTLITAIRNSAVLGSLSGFSPEHPAGCSGFGAGDVFFLFPRRGAGGCPRESPACRNPDVNSASPPPRTGVFNTQTNPPPRRGKQGKSATWYSPD